MSTPLPTVKPEKLAEYIGVTDAAMKKAAAFQQGIEKTAAAVEALIPGCLDALVENERIEPHQREKAAALLRDPVKVIEILTKVAKHRNHSENSLGTSTPSSTDKQAGATGGSKLSPADQKFWSDMGLEVPVE